MCTEIRSLKNPLSHLDSVYQSKLVIFIKSILGAALIGLTASSCLSGERVAVVCLTDYHCNSQKLDGLRKALDNYSKSYNSVILLINGDLSTKFIAHDNNLGKSQVTKRATAIDSTLQRYKDLTKWLVSALKANRNLHVVFTVGNHELKNHVGKSGITIMAHIYSCFCSLLRYGKTGDNAKTSGPALGNRVNFLSNFRFLCPSDMQCDHEPMSGLKNLVKPSCEIEGITFLGYTTNAVSSANSPYSKAYKNQWIADETKADRIDSLKKEMEKARTKVVILASHAGSTETAGLSLDIASGVTSVCVLGHAHHEFRRGQIRKDGTKGAIPKFDYTLAPKPLFCSYVLMVLDKDTGHVVGSPKAVDIKDTTTNSTQRVKPQMSCIGH
jgi:hypothetical protein